MSSIVATGRVTNTPSIEMPTGLSSVDSMPCAPRPRMKIAAELEKVATGWMLMFGVEGARSVMSRAAILVSASSPKAEMACGTSCSDSFLKRAVTMMSFVSLAAVSAGASLCAIAGAAPAIIAAQATPDSRIWSRSFIYTLPMVHRRRC